MVNFNPYEQRKLESLQPALRQGLDPSIAYEIFSGVESGALNRMAENRAMRQQMFADASDELRGAASMGMPQGGAMDLVESYQAETPGLARGKYQGRLEDLAGGLYEGPGKFSSTFQPEEGAMAPGGGGGDIDPETQAEADALLLDTVKNQQLSRSMTTPPVPGELEGAGLTTLHDLRMLVMTKLRNQGVPEGILQSMYDYLGQQFTNLGGDPGMAPVTGGPAPTAAPTSAVGGAPAYTPPNPGGTSAMSGVEDARRRHEELMRQIAAGWGGG